MNIVIDTNIFISATISIRQKPFLVVEEIRKKKYTLVVSPQLIHEWRRVLFYERIQKYRVMSNKEVLNLLGDIERVSMVVSLRNAEIKPVVKNDPDDNIVLATAIKGKARYIITGDRHLLALQEYKNIAIITPAEFLKSV